MKLLRIGLILCVALVSSCSPRLRLSLASPEEGIPHPRFVVDDPDHPQQPRYDTIEVWDTTKGREAAKATLVWKLRADPFTQLKGVRQFSYGKPLDGFKELVPAIALEPGHKYALRVVGLGDGHLHLSVDRRGKLHLEE